MKRVKHRPIMKKFKARDNINKYGNTKSVKK